MKTDRKISDILWDAANKHLCPPGEEGKGVLWEESCCAVAEAENGHDQWVQCQGNSNVSKPLRICKNLV